MGKGVSCLALGREKAWGFDGLSRGRGERKGVSNSKEDFGESWSWEERRKERGFLRENLEKGGGFRLGELDFLKRSRLILHSKELNINPPSLRAKLGALKCLQQVTPFTLRFLGLLLFFLACFLVLLLIYGFCCLLGVNMMVWICEHGVVSVYLHFIISSCDYIAWKLYFLHFE